MANTTSAVTIGLPTGGKLTASPNLQLQSAECSATANLQTQIAPWIASVSCQFLILKLLKPLIEVIRQLPTPSPQAVVNFLNVSEELAPCLLAPTPASILPFARELLCLEIRSLNCFRNNLQAMAKLTAAEPSAVPTSEVQSVIDSYQPIIGILDLANGIFGMAGLTLPQAPALANGTGPASLMTDQRIVTALITTLQTAVEALGGCA
jgi:hypothetical protein